MTGAPALSYPPRTVRPGSLLGGRLHHRGVRRCRPWVLTAPGERAECDRSAGAELFRPARIKPGQALAEASVERLRPGLVRTLLGLGALAGGAILTGVSARSTGDDAAGAALGVVMLFMLSVGLLGPLVARLCAGLFGLPLRGVGPAAGLAAANSRTNARRLASAITPIVWPWPSRQPSCSCIRARPTPPTSSCARASPRTTWWRTRPGSRWTRWTAPPARPAWRRPSGC